MDIDHVWSAFKATGDIELRNQLVVHYNSLVRYIASRVVTSLPASLDREDLVSYGQFGLMEAIDRYDLERGVKFETFAITRIKGAIIDELRALDWVPRSVRSKAKDVEKVALQLEVELGRAPEDHELAAALGLTVPELWVAQSESTITSVVALDEHDYDDDRVSVGQRLYDMTASPEGSFEVEEIGEVVANAIDRLPEASKIILVLYYIEEMTLAEIGELMGVTESRVCQLQSKLLQGLRENLGYAA
jgi:RNA polymerase sigma factor FliA